MGTPFLGELKIVSFDYAPQGWAQCNGQFLPINQNQALFSILGTTYGGNGQTTFALPDMRGRVPIHFGSGHTLGEAAGSTAVTLTLSQLPQHIHFAQSTTNAADNNVPDNTVLLADTAPNDLYTGAAGLTPLIASTISSVGGRQPHENVQPYLCINYIISLFGIFPPRS